jgi:hypothetical protein
MEHYYSSSSVTGSSVQNKSISSDDATCNLTLFHCLYFTVTFHSGFSFLLVNLMALLRLEGLGKLEKKNTITSSRIELTASSL